MLNRTLLIGNLTDNPSELRTAGQSQVCDFRLAHNDRFGAGGERERTLYIDVECWGRTAENVSRFLEKGRQVLVEGRLQQDEWTDNDGNRRSKIKVVALNVTFMSGGEKGEPREPREQQRREPQPARREGRNPGRYSGPPQNDSGVPF